MPRRDSPPRRSFARFCGDVLDSIVLAVNPLRGAQRIAMRRTWDRLEARHARFSGSGYEGAESDRLRADRWMSSRLSPDSALELGLVELRDRSRQLYKNDTIGGAIDSKVNLTVGGGFTPQAAVKPTPGIVSPEEHELVNEAQEQLWRRWSRRASRDRKRSLWQLLRLAGKHLEFDGEAIVVMSDVGDSVSPIPLVLEVVDPERLETPPGESGNPRVRLGIETDDDGRITHYHLRRTHPGDTVETDWQYDRVPADRVLHVFEPWFAGQSRGLPWLTRTLNTLRDSKDLDEAALVAAQVEACYAAFIESPMSPGRGALGAGNGTADSGSGRQEQEINPGMVKYMGPGEKVTFGNPTRASGVYAAFQNWVWQRISGALNWPKELLTKDWKSLSFAAGHLALGDASLAASCTHRLLIELMLAPVWDRVQTEGVITGVLPIDPVRFRRHKHLWLSHEWIPPAWPYSLNPVDKVRADLEEIEGNLATRKSKVSARGGVYENVMRQRQLERQEEIDRGIVPRVAGTSPAESAEKDAAAGPELEEAAA